MLSFREMQLKAEVEYSTEQTRADLGRIVKFFKSQSYYAEGLDLAFVKERVLPLSVAEEHDVFFVDGEATTVNDLPEDLRHESLGMVKGKHLVYGGRLVYPVKDVKGSVMGFCGWDKWEKPKYLDSKNSGYKAKENTFYGMEKLPEYYRSNRPIYVVEGIVCCLYLRSIGLQAVAILGSSLNKYVIQIFKRVESRLVFFPDNDVIGKSIEELNQSSAAGEHFVKVVKRNLPKSRIIQSKIAKDVDDTRLLDNFKHEEVFKQELTQVVSRPFMPYKTIRVR